MRPVGFRPRSIACILSFLALAAAPPAAAGPLSLLWDASAGPNVAGYIVYVRIPGGTGNAYDVGNATSFDWTGAVDGQQYYFAVAAYAPGNVVGARSPEISRYPDTAPALTNPGPQIGTAGTSLTLQLTGNDPEGRALIYDAANLPPGLSVGGSGAISGTPTTAGPFVVTATVTDGELTDTETFTWTIAAAPPPTVVIAVPTANPPAPTAANPPAPTVLNPAPETPVSTVPTIVIPPGAQPTPPAAQPVAGPTAVPRAAPLVSPNRFARWRDAERNTATAPNPERSVLARGPRPQAVAPAPDDTNRGTTLVERLRAAVQRVASPVPITAPVPTAAVTPLTVTATTQAARNTSWGRAKLGTTVTDQPFITLAGTAADDRVVTSVEWVSDRGLHGTATGTDTWIAAVPLLRGLNKITINVRDSSGNVSSSTVAVQYDQRPLTLKK